jgi:hypothetical protein
MRIWCIKIGIVFVLHVIVIDAYLKDPFGNYRDHKGGTQLYIIDISLKFEFSETFLADIRTT